MKKTLALFLVVAMACTLIAGMAVGEEKPVLHVMAQTDVRQMSWAEMGMFKDAAANAGVEIEWEEISTGWTEKKPVILASGDLPDIIINDSTITSSDIISNIDSFMDMTDLIAAYAPNIQKMFEEVPDSLTASMYNGGIYALPLVTAYMPTSYVTLNINKTWLDKLGLEVPTTLDEFEQCLIAFRDGDPNGNGIKDEIPLDWPQQGHTHDIYCLTGAFGTVDNQSTNMVVVEDGKVQFLYETEAFYKLTQYVHRWYEEGLITPEVYTNDYAASNVVRTTGDIARVGAATGYSAPSLFSKFSDEYISIAPLSGGEEYDVKWPFSTVGAPVNSNKLVMTSDCENPEAAMRFINELYSDDFGIQEYYGSFDTGAVTKYDDGTYSIQLVEGYGSIDEMKWYLSPVNNGPGYFSADLVSRTKAPAELTDRTVTEELYIPYRNDPKDIWPTYARFNEEQNEELVYLQSDIQNLVSQKMAAWCVNGGIEDEWDDYINSLKMMGLEEMRAIYQEVYDAYWAEQP